MLAYVSGRLLESNLYGGRFAVKILQNRMIWNILKRFFFGSTKFDEFRFLKNNFENFESVNFELFACIFVDFHFISQFYTYFVGFP